MPLGVDVGLSPGDFVLDGEPVPPPRHCGQTAKWIKMPRGTEVGLGLRDIVFDVDPATPRKKVHPLPPNFWPMSIVVKWLDG